MLFEQGMWNVPKFDSQALAQTIKKDHNQINNPGIG